MKLHRISLRNLNSLYGEHVVDLDTDLGGASLFLVMGPTGSGKSTLLDAISLALFGRTPRLGAPARKGHDTSTVVSRGTGGALARVDFSKRTASGRRHYRAEWQVWRAHNKPTGDLQTPRRRLFERIDDEWRPLHARDDVAKEWGPAFREVLEGFTVEAFQRSMLLAQGEFDAFLSAKAEDRAEVLERLTETTAYKAIGERASRIRRAWQNRIKTLGHQIDGIGGMDATTREATEVARDETEQRLDRHRSDRAFLTERIDWLVEHRELEDGVADARAAIRLVEVERLAEQAALDRLADHEQLGTVFSALDQLDHAQERHTELSRELANLEARLPELVASAATASGALQQAEARLAARREQLRQLRALVDGYVTTDNALRTALREVARAEAALDQRRQHERTQLAAVGRAEANHETASQAHGDARRSLTQHADDGRIRDALPALRADTQTVATDLAEAATETTEARLASEAQAAELARLEAAHAALLERRQLQMGPLVARAEEAEAQLETRLAGELLPEQRIRKLRADADAHDARGLALEQAAGALAAWGEAAQQRRERSASVEQGRSTARDRQRLAEAARAALDAAVAREQRARRALSRTRSLATIAEHRHALEAGEPCPLCGSPDHPLLEAGGHADADARIREAVEAAVRETTEAEQAAQLARTAHATAAQTAARAEQARDDAMRDREVLAARVDALKAEAVATCRPLKFRYGRDPDEAAARARAEAEAARDAADQRRTDADAVEHARNERNNRREQVRTAEAGFAEDLRRLETDLVAIQERGLAMARQRADAAEATGQALAARGALADRYTDLGISPDAGTPSSWLADAERHGAAHEARVQAVEATLTAVREAAATLEQARIVASTAVSGTAEALEALADRRVQSERAHAAQRTALAAVDGLWATLDHEASGPPTARLEALAGSEQRDAEGVEAARRRHREAERVNIATQANRDHLTAELARAVAARADADAAVRAQLSEAGIADTRALRERRLDPAEAAAIRALRRGLDQRRAALDERLEDRRRRLHELDGRRPAHTAPEADPDFLGSLVAHLEVQAARERAGLEELDRQLTIDDDRRDHRRSLEAQLADVRKRAGVWLHLHELIGTGDGEAFKTFAQSLNLGRLLDQANHHLAQLSQRYRLVIESDDKGMPTLEFLVEDVWQQGTLRSPRTLSGGERFLVSLALALGLSDLRNISMPIETLLLDEGFGTLDTETLDVALAALQQLRASGRQVGIISHVVGLHERVEARVVVEPQGGGRSRLRTVLGS
jgi:exonuclease SbcC